MQPYTGGVISAANGAFRQALPLHYGLAVVLPKTWRESHVQIFTWCAIFFPFRVVLSWTTNTPIINFKLAWKGFICYTNTRIPSIMTRFFVAEFY